MRKILISILIILLVVFTYFVIARSVNFGFLKIESVKDIKAASEKLNQDFDEANNLSNKTYPNEVQTLEETIKKLKISKQEYENKKLYSNSDVTIGSVEVKTYTIHYLWTVLGNYRKDTGVRTLNLDLKSTQNSDVYDLQFTLTGSYTSITDFLYGIENDEELNFEVENFSISSEIKSTQNNSTPENNQNTVSNTNSALANNSNSINSNTVNNNTPTTTQNNTNSATSQKGDGTILQATFSVSNIGITLE